MVKFSLITGASLTGIVFLFAVYLSTLSEEESSAFSCNLQKTTIKLRTKVLKDTKEMYKGRNHTHKAKQDIEKAKRELAGAEFMFKEECKGKEEISLNFNQP